MLQGRGEVRLGARLLYGLLLVSAAVGGVLSTRPPQAQAEGKDKIVARVNNEPIYESEISSSIPKDTFQDDAVEIRRTKMEHRIGQLQLKQYLTAHKADAVSAAEMDKAVAELRKNPPSLGCACCRYKSLEQFLKVNMLTMADFREDVRNDMALNKYVLGLWNQAYPTPQSRTALIVAQRKQTEGEFTRAWQIFFNTYQLADQHLDPAKVKRDAQAKADAAWKRLQKGESFAAVAKSVSEDQMSRSAGGKLGFIVREAYGKDFAAMLTRLKPGEVSRPFESIYGIHIIKWEPILDSDLLDITKMLYVERRSGEILDEAEKNAKVVKY
jgi:parvulin-like peptidyl-prolyl isomerase